MTVTVTMVMMTMMMTTTMVMMTMVVVMMVVMVMMMMTMMMMMMIISSYRVGREPTPYDQSTCSHHTRYHANSKTVARAFRRVRRAIGSARAIQPGEDT